MNNPTPVIRWSGNAQQAQAALAAAQVESAQVVVIDLTQAADSPELREFLIWGVLTCNTSSLPLHLVPDSPASHKLLKKLGLHGAVPLYESVAQALDFGRAA